jgi:CheY-like chemotaxis protein
MFPVSNSLQCIKRILVVDDAAMNRKMLVRLLVGKVDVIEEAEDGQIALDMISKSMMHNMTCSDIVIENPMDINKNVTLTNTFVINEHKTIVSEHATIGLDTIYHNNNNNNIDNNNNTADVFAYDVILMDFVMPCMDGPTATYHIRNTGYKGLIIGVTGNTMQFDVDHFIEKGANSVLPKPVSTTMLETKFLEFGYKLNPNRDDFII